jgi:F-type H+-transporting ATPase subunit b
VIDWFTVFAQIVNFIILIFLLKRFLYGPIIAAIDKREENISARITEAEEKHLAAEE